MSLKDIKREYAKIEQTYLELLSNLEEVKSSDLCASRIEQAETLLAPYKSTYETWSYIMWKLNEPTRKRKKGKYRKDNDYMWRYLKDRHATFDDKYEESIDILANFKILAKEWEDEDSGTSE